MTTVEILRTTLKVKPEDLDDPFLSEVQRQFDKKFFDPPHYSLAERAGNRITKRDLKINHVAKHVGLLVAKFHKTARHDIRGDWPSWKREILPEVLIARTRLANTLRIPLAEILPPDQDEDRSRRRDLVDRRHTRVTLASNQLHIAHQALFEYVTPLEAGRIDAEKRQAIANLAIPALHDCGLVLAKLTGQDRATSHMNYLVDHMSPPSEAP